MASKSKMTGAADMARAFNRLPASLNTPINAGARKALRPMLAAAKRNTPHKSIKKALVIKTDRTAPKNRPTAVVGGNPRYSDYRLLHLLELGTAPHKIGKWFHPGAKAQPFLRPAFEETKDQVFDLLGKEAWIAIEKWAARLAAKANK